MKLPIDVKAALEAALGATQAAQESVSVSLYIDGTAPADVVACVRGALAEAAGGARITMGYLGKSRIEPEPFDDMAVIVAGVDERVGEAAAILRSQGLPVMVATTLPVVVDDIARTAGFPLAAPDIVSPVPFEADADDKARLAALEQEPVALDDEAARALLDRMGEWVVEACRAKRLAMARALPFVRRPLALEAVGATAVQNAGIGVALFIPGADLPVMTLNQVKMILQIAAAFGEPMSVGRAFEVAGVVGGAFACRSVARRVAGLLPGVGWLVKGVVGYAGTVAMGRAAIAYFEHGAGAAGFAGAVADAGECAVHTVVEIATSSAAREQRASDARDQARDFTARAVTVGRTVAAAAAPVAREAARMGAETFTKGIRAIVR